MVVTRGDVWWTDLGDPRGSAPALVRPAVIVSADEFNASRIATVTVVAVTSSLRLAPFPGNVLIPAGQTALTEDSVVNVTQVATADRTQLLNYLGALPDWLMAQVDAGLARALSLR